MKKFGWKINLCWTSFQIRSRYANIEANIVLGDAIDFINSIGIDQIQKHEDELLNYTHQKLSELDEVIIYAENAKRAGAISFNLNIDGVHPSDVGMILDKRELLLERVIIALNRS